jgi:hypothetical protein
VAPQRNRTIRVLTIIMGRAGAGRAVLRRMLWATAAAATLLGDGGPPGGGCLGSQHRALRFERGGWGPARKPRRRHRCMS